MSRKLLWVWKIDLYTLIRGLYDSENIDGIAISIDTLVLLKPKKDTCVQILHNYSICPVIPKVRRFVLRPTRNVKYHVLFSWS
jgi:hypothetical protein